MRLTENNELHEVLVMTAKILIKSCCSLGKDRNVEISLIYTKVAFLKNGFLMKDYFMDICILNKIERPNAFPYSQSYSDIKLFAHTYIIPYHKSSIVC